MTPPGRVVLAHGFTQTARSWDTFAALLRDRIPGAEVVAVDMPGHGANADVRADLWQSADHLTEVGGRGTYIGYSMGGRVTLHAALAHPRLVERMVLIGATAGIDDEQERAARRHDDERLADHIEAVGVEVFIDEWLTSPLFAGLNPQTTMRDDRLRNTAAGLASSLRTTGTGTQEALWDRLDEIRVPVLVIVGGDDAKFHALGERIVALVPRSEIVVIDGVGHSVHLEAPVATAEVVARWLTKVLHRDQTPM